MFSIKWKGEVHGHSCGISGEVLFDGEVVCVVHTWAFSSCACYALQGFRNYNHTFTKESAEQFFTLLNTEEPTSGWLPEEMYFLLTASQSSSLAIRELVNHPCVRKVDSFINKAHGGNIMKLFRYSLDNDFPKETKE